MLERLFRWAKGYDYKLERFSWGEGDRGGEGYTVLRVSDNQKLSWKSIPKSSGLLVFNIAGTSFREDSIQHPSFSPGEELSLVPEPDNPEDSEAIAVYNRGQTIHAGYVPGDRRADVAGRLESGKPYRCISMWENKKDGKRVGIRVLIAEHDVNIKWP